MDELTLGDKIYISSKRAAEITGYAKDYVGQLCREGHVEAQMVGRSWYVLESSIREHRFGKSVEPAAGPKPHEAVEAEKATDMELPSTWEAPRYSVEVSAPLPKVIEKPKDAPKAVPEEATAAISDMQAAWKEWFEQKQPERIESPEVIDAREIDAEEARYRAEREVYAPATPSAYEIEARDQQEEDPEEVAIPVKKIVSTSARPQESFHGRVQEAEEGSINLPIRTLRRAPTFKPAERAYARPSVAPAVTRASAPRDARTGGINVIEAAVLVVVALVAVAIAAVSTGYADRYLQKNPILEFLGGTSTINNK